MAGLFDSQSEQFDAKVGQFDDGGTDALGSGSITTASPTLATTTVASNAALTANSILTAAPNVLATTITQEHSLTPTVIVTGSPLISTVGLTQDHQLSPTSVATQSPVVNTTDLIENVVFATVSLETGTPVVSVSAISQTHSLSPTSITTARPQVQDTVDPSWITNQEIQEIQDMFGGWPRRSYEVPDGRLVQAEREIELQFGEKVSIDRKAKSLIKFGKSAPLNTTSLQTVWTVGGNETYVNDNLIDSISSSNVNDTQEILLECHTVDADGNFTFLTQTVNLNGQTRVALPVPVARVSMAYNNNGTEIQGRVAVYENTALTGGIPTDTTKIHIDIPLGLQESFKAATTFSNTDYFILTGGFGSVSSKQAGAADFYLELREQGKVFRQVAAISATSSGPWEVKLDPAVVISKNADVRVRAETEDNNLVVFTVFQGYLAKVL
jgi:hypothetical protein